MVNNINGNLYNFIHSNSLFIINKNVILIDMTQYYHSRISFAGAYDFICCSFIVFHSLLYL